MCLLDRVIFFLSCTCFDMLFGNVFLKLLSTLILGKVSKLPASGTSSIV